MDDYANHRERRNQILEDHFGLKVENRQPQHPDPGSLDGLLKDTARSHRDSVRNGGGAGRGVPSNSADLGYDSRNRDSYDRNAIAKHHYQQQQQRETERQQAQLKQQHQPPAISKHWSKNS
jgi:hypothetical protein